MGKHCILPRLTAARLSGAAFGLALCAVTAVSAFDMSIGGGGFVGWDFAGGVRFEDRAVDPPIKKDWGLYHGGGGAYLFFDALYGEVSVSGYHGEGSPGWRLTDGIIPLNDSVQPADESVKFSFNAVNIGVAGKYPRKISEKVTTYALLGLDYSLVVNGEYRYYTDAGGGRLRERVEDWEPWATHFNALWVKFGGGAYCNLTDGGRLYLRPEAQYGLRLANKWEKDYTYWRSGWKTTLGHGFLIKLALGYRFYVKD